MTKFIALAFAIVLGLGQAASALEGYDGDNNAVPGANGKWSQQP